MEAVLKLIAISVFIVAVVLGTELLRPVRTSTKSVSKIIPVKKGVKIDFETHYSYGYFIALNSIDSNAAELRFVKYKLTIDGDVRIGEVKSTSANGDLKPGTFSADEGDLCSFEILDFNDEAAGKNAFLMIDVNGGGPSVGIAWEKEFRPVTKRVFWGVSGLFILLLALIYKDGLIEIVSGREKNFKE